MQLAALKREALEEKHLLEHYFTIYAAFQDYVDKLTPYVLGKPPNPEMLVAYERFRLLFAEHESAFLEWHDGLQLINDGVATFLGNLDCFENNPAGFRLALSMATTKFEILSKTAARDLRELHEHIALLEGQEKAEKVTGVPVSALKKLEDLDTAMEIGRKWLGRAVQYTPWVIDTVRCLGGP
jgi:hypothetical protein